MRRFMGSQRVGHDRATELNFSSLLYHEFSHLKDFRNLPLRFGKQKRFLCLGTDHSLQELSSDLTSSDFLSSALIGTPRWGGQCGGGLRTQLGG